MDWLTFMALFDGIYLPRYLIPRLVMGIWGFGILWLFSFFIVSMERLAEWLLTGWIA